MSWLNRISVQESEAQEPEPKNPEQKMSPGLTGEYDWELREKAGLRSPPPPPENMGVEGEYDLSGLVKRVAIALDKDPLITDLTTLEIIQKGRAIVFKGEIADRDILNRIVEITAQVDGTEIIDVNGVVVH